MIDLFGRLFMVSMAIIAVIMFGSPTHKDCPPVDKPIKGVKI